MSLLKTDRKDVEGEDEEGEDIEEMLEGLCPGLKDKVKEVKEKIKEAKEANKRSLLQTDDETKRGEDFMDAIEHTRIFNSLSEELQEEIRAKMEEIEKMLEEGCEKNHKITEMKDKIMSLLKTDRKDVEGEDEEGEDIEGMLEDLCPGLKDKVKEVKEKIKEAKEANKRSLLQTDDETKRGEDFMDAIEHPRIFNSLSEELQEEIR